MVAAPASRSAPANRNSVSPKRAIWLGENTFTLAPSRRRVNQGNTSTLLLKNPGIRSSFLPMLPLPLPLAPTLAGFRGIRGDVLVAVKKSQPVTAKELAAEFGLTPNAVRRHLKELEAEGLVGCARQVRGVGGPMLGYSLTEAGEALFPRAYESTLTSLLDTVREQRGTEGVVELFQSQWKHLAEGAKVELAALPLNERAQ